MALKDTIEKAKKVAKKMGVSDSAINAVANATESVASSVSNAAKNSESGEVSVNGTRVTGTGHDMVIHPKESSGSRTAGNVGGGIGTTTDYGTYRQDLDRLTKAQRQAQVDELKAARRQALASLDAQEQNIKPTYQNARNLTSASSQQGARNFAEYLANRGLTNSGAVAQAEINRQSALNNNLGNINTAEANALRDIANQRTAVENNYVSGLANANNALTNNYYNNLLNYNEQQRQMVQALQNQALGQYANDYQAQINSLLAQGYDPNSLEVLRLQALRGNKANNLYQAGQTNALNNIQAGNINYNNAAQLGMTVPQAQQYYENLQAQNQAAQLAQQQALEREVAQQQWKNEMDYNNYLLNAQKVANDTAQTNYNVNKPYNSTVYHVSNNNGNEGKTNYMSYKDAVNLIGNSQNPQATADAMIDNGLINEETWRVLYAANPEWKI